jgi:hypothetical protein
MTEVLKIDNPRGLLSATRLYIYDRLCYRILISVDDCGCGAPPGTTVGRADLPMGTGVREVAMINVHLRRDQRRQRRLFERNGRLSLSDLMAFWAARRRLRRVPPAS